MLIHPDVRVLEDGSIAVSSDEAKRLIDEMGLDRPKLRAFRLLWISIIRLAEKYDVDLWAKLIGFPEDLPDLSQLQPPSGNARPEGIHQSYLARRQRGELSSTF